MTPIPPSNGARFGQIESDLITATAQRSGARLREKLGLGAYIYGAGSFGRRVLRLLNAQGFTCHGMIDRRAGPDLQAINGTPVIHPAALTPAMCQNRVFILGIFNPFDDMGEIVTAFRNHGFADIFWAADLPEALGPGLNDFWLSARHIFLDNFPRIRALADILADQMSVDCLESVIRFRALDKPGRPPSIGTQYLPAGLPGFDRPISFLDGGAYDGDTFRSLTGFGVQIEHWLAFEPDPDNFAKLSQFAKACATRATLIPCGLSDRAHQVQFAPGQREGSRILGNEAGTGAMIQCLAIDDSFQNIPIDYIKLDIEGAERAALDGMAKTITTYRPRLAVSSYHHPADLWDIPLQLKALLPNSAIYLRQHQQNTFDVVAYAIPRKP